MVLSDFRPWGFTRGSNCFCPDSVDKEQKQSDVVKVTQAVGD